MANFRIDGDNLRDNSGSRVARVERDNIYDNSGSRIATVDVVKKAIQGATGTMTDVALWWAATHKR